MIWLMKILEIELGLGNIDCPPETHLKPKSREISFVHNLFLGYPIILQSCSMNGSDIVVLCTKFRNDWTTEIDIIDERDFARF